MRTKKKSAPRPKCSACGYYVSLVDVALGKVLTRYTPDSEYGPEQMEWIHASCQNHSSLEDRANRAIAALRKPDHSLANVANTVRQSIADIIDELMKSRA